MDDSKTLKNIENRLSALIALNVLAIFEGKDRDIKPEVLLSESGLDSSEIAKLLGKKVGAVQKVIQRSKK